MKWISFGVLPCKCVLFFPVSRIVAHLGALYRGADKSLARPGRKQANVSVSMTWISFGALPCKCVLLFPVSRIVAFLGALYRGADKSLARPGRKQANVPVRMAWISFGALPCRKKKTWWLLASRCCWKRARPWHASELVSLLVGAKDLSAPQ